MTGEDLTVCLTIFVIREIGLCDRKGFFLRIKNKGKILTSIRAAFSPMRRQHCVVVPAGKQDSEALIHFQIRIVQDRNHRCAKSMQFS